MVVGETLHVTVTDNDSTDATKTILREFHHKGVIVHELAENIGFSGAHNSGAFLFMEGPADYLVVLNPDLALSPRALAAMAETLPSYPAFSAATGLLYRGEPGEPLPSIKTIDSSGMVFTSGYRHFDRGADEIDSGQFAKIEAVAGITGAFMVLTRPFISAVLLSTNREQDVDQIYPALSRQRERRLPLFDEGFFAYREDAELCLRGSLLNQRFLLVPAAWGVHRRRVTPERRGDLPQEINRLGVRNRFLLQLSTFHFPSHWRWILTGLLLRNMVVILGVFLTERSSIRGIREAIILAPRALSRRRELLRRRANNNQTLLNEKISLANSSF